MRAELTFKALAREPNGFLLCLVVATATRKLHRPNTRVQETMNDAFVRLSVPGPTLAAAVREPSSAQKRRAA